MKDVELKKVLTIFENEVAIRYQKHEETFDLESFHGRFHIIRCLLLADTIHKYYTSNSINFDVEKSYYAILFHDIMREDNGIDLWEAESAKECLAFLKQKGFSKDYAFQTSKIILKF